MDSSFTSQPSAEEVPDVLQTVHQGVDLGGRGVQIERRSRRRGNSVPQADRAGAVVADPDGDAHLVEYLTHVVRVDVAEREGDRRPAVLGRRRADDPQVRDLQRRFTAYSVIAFSCWWIFSMPIAER